MKIVWNLCLIITVALGSLFMVGCEPAAAVKKAELTSMVAGLEKHYDTIKTGLEAGDADGTKAAHDAFHGGGIFDSLQGFTELGSNSGLPAADRDQVQTAAEAMAEAYGKIDGAMHKGESVNYADHAEAISEALATIKKIAK